MTLAPERSRMLAHAVPLLTGFRRGERMRMQARQYYTAEMVRALPDDGNRYETVYGELLVSPSPRPRHQIVGARIFGAFFKYVEDNPGPMVLYSPADLSFGRDDVLVQPDIFVLRPEHASFAKWDTVGRLLLAIEILSASTARHDRFTKRRLYQELGADEYWIVDPDGMAVEVWTPDAHFPRVGIPVPFVDGAERNGSIGSRSRERPAGVAEPSELVVAGASDMATTTRRGSAGRSMVTYVIGSGPRHQRLSRPTRAVSCR